MQQIRKNQKSILLELAFHTIFDFNYSFFWYIIILFVHIPTLGFTVIQKLPTPLSIDLPYRSIFIGTSICFAIFLLISCLAITKKIMLSFWGYLLLLFQAASSFFIQIAVKCYSNDNWCEGDIKYEVMVVIISILMFLIILVFRSLYYYPLYDSQNIHSMKNGLVAISLFAYKLILSIIFNNQNLNDPKIHTTIFFFLTLILFSLNYKKSYRHFVPTTFWNIFYSILLWTASIIYIIPNLQSLSMNQQIFNSGGLIKQTLYYSLGFIILFSYGFEKRIHWQNFFQNVHEVKSKQQIYQKISNLVHHLNKLKKSDQRWSDKNYKLLLLKMQSHKEKCNIPTCQIKQIDKVINSQDDEKMQVKKMNKNIDLCFRVCSDLLEQLLMKFPNTLEIIIFTANFHQEAFRIKTKALALGNNNLKKSKIQYQDQYAIFYIRSKIQYQNKQKIQLNKQAIQSEINEFQHNIQVSVSMLTQFWYILSDPKCNLKKLYELANELFPVKIEVDNMWSKIEGLKNIDSYSLYAKYLIEIFNDKQKGLEILQQAKKIEIENRNKKQLNFFVQNSKILDPDGIVFCELDQNNIGKIYQSNLSAQKMFGYQKRQMIDKKINDIMPKIIANWHDKLLQNYKLTNKVKVMNKQRSLFGKSKSGYLFPITLRIKPIKNFYNQKIEIYGCLKYELSIKQVMIFIINNEYLITDINFSVINFFPLLNPQILQKKNLYMRQIVQNFDQYMKQQLFDHDIQINHTYEINSKIISQKLYFMISVNRISISIAGEIGYQVKLTRKHIKSEQLIKQHNQTSHFTFNLNLTKLSNSNTYQINFLGVSMSQQKFLKQLEESNASFIEYKKLQTNNRQKIDYTLDIITKRLSNQQLIDVVKKQKQKEVLVEQQKIQKNNSSINSNIRAKQLSSILEKQQGNSKLKTLKLLSTIALFISIIISIVNFLLQQNIINNLSSNLENVVDFNLISCQMQYIAQYVIYFLNYLPSSNLVSEYKNSIDQLNTLSKKSSFSRNTQLFYNDNTSSSIYLSFALDKLVSQANLIQGNNSVNKMNNSQIFFIIFNVMNDLQLNMQGQQMNKMNIIQSGMNYKQQLSILLLVVIVPIVIIFMIINNILLQNILKNKTQILEVFFQIPRKTCKNFMNQCQFFIQKIASQNNDIQFNQIDDQFDNQQNHKQESLKKKRLIQGKDSTKPNFLIATIVWIIFICSYQIIVLIYSRYQQNSIKNSIKLLQQLSNYQKNLVFNLNSINIFIQNGSNAMILGANTFQQSFNYLNSSIFKMVEANYQYKTKFFIQKLKYDTLFLNLYNNIMYDNLCGVQFQCNHIIDLSHGLNGFSGLYIQNVTQKFDSFVNLTSQSNISKTTLDNQIITQKVIKYYYRKAVGLMMQQIHRILKYNQNVMFGVLLSIIILNVIILYFGWMKFFDLIQKQIMATSHILTFIPINEINKNPQIYNYIMKNILNKK